MDLSWYAVGNGNLSSAALLIRKARLFLLGSTILWALGFPLMRALELTQRSVVPDISEQALACIDIVMRFGLAALFMVPLYGRGLRRVSWQEWSQAIGLAVFATGGAYLQTVSLALTDASIAAFLTQIYSLIVPIIVGVRDRQWPGMRVVCACVLVVAGVALLSPGLLQHLTMGRGERMVLLSAIFLAAQVVWVERPVYAENRPGVVTMIMFALIAAFCIPGYFLNGGSFGTTVHLFGTPVLIFITLALVLLGTLFNFLIMNAWQRCVSATEAGIIYSIEPVLAALMCAFFPGWISHFATIAYADETLTWGLYAGGALVVAATILMATAKRTAY